MTVLLGNRPMRAVAPILVFILVAACSSAGSSTPPPASVAPAPTQAASVAPAPTQAASVAPAPTQAASVAPSQAAPVFSVGTMVWETSNPFYVPFIKGQKDAAAKYGINIDVQNGNSDMQTQIAVVQQFISQKKDLIIVTPGDAQAIVPVVQQADAAGVPVIAANNNVGSGGKVITFIGTSNYDLGVDQCKMLVQAIGKKGNVGYILGALGTDPQVNRQKGMTDCLKDYPDIHIVAQQTASWDFTKALAIVQDWLSKYPSGQLNAIVDQGPEAVTGAEYAYKNGRTDVKFILENFPATVKSAILDGSVYGTVVEDPYNQGFTSVEYAYYWLTGQKDKVEQPQHFMPTPLVTKDNAAQTAPNM